MQTLTEKVYNMAPPGGLFDETVVINLFPKHSRDAQKALVHRAVRHNEVLRLKPGLFCLATAYRRQQPHLFVVAGMLHSPSQISLESALSYHGLIPESVYQVTSVTTRRSRTFRTPLGHFSFHRVPCKNLRAGVNAEKLDKNAWAFVATPLRAIADLVYLRKEVSWENDGLGFLTDSMRIEDDDLKQISFESFDEIHQSLRNLRAKRYLVGLRKELSS